MYKPQFCQMYAMLIDSIDHVESPSQFRLHPSRPIMLSKLFSMPYSVLYTMPQMRETMTEEMTTGINPIVRNIPEPFSPRLSNSASSRPSGSWPISPVTMMMTLFFTDSQKVSSVRIFM
ncbi:hypothetical protein D1872_277200 [compost metagenome]